MRYNISIDTGPQQQDAASPQCVVALSFSRYMARQAFRLARVFGLTGLIAVVAYAQTAVPIPYESPRAAYTALSKDSHARLARNGEGWTVVDVSEGPNRGVWTFPPQSHSTFPSVVRRQVLERDGSLYIGMGVMCGGAKLACDQFVAEFTKVNEQIAKKANEKRGK
jgi:hypothetical protein